MMRIMSTEKGISRNTRAGIAEFRIPHALCGVMCRRAGSGFVIHAGIHRARIL